MINEIFLYLYEINLDLYDTLNLTQLEKWISQLETWVFQLYVLVIRNTELIYISDVLVLI